MQKKFVVGQLVKIKRDRAYKRNGKFVLPVAAIITEIFTETVTHPYHFDQLIEAEMAKLHWFSYEIPEINGVSNEIYLGYYERYTKKTQLAFLSDFNQYINNLKRSKKELYKQT